MSPAWLSAEERAAKIVYRHLATGRMHAQVCGLALCVEGDVVRTMRVDGRRWDTKGINQAVAVICAGISDEIRAAEVAAIERCAEACDGVCKDFNNSHGDDEAAGAEACAITIRELAREGQ